MARDKTPQRDSSLVETQLAPHLRRRQKGKGGASLTTTVAPLPTVDTLLASYVADDVQELALAPFETQCVGVDLASVLVSLVGVTTEPFTLVSATGGSYAVTLNGRLSGVFGWLAIRVNGIDQQTYVGPRISTVAFINLDIDDVLTLWLCGANCLNHDVLLSASDVSIAISQA